MTEDEIQAGLDRLVEIMVRTAMDRYRKLFPWAEDPPFADFEAWMARVGTSWNEFGFVPAEPKELARRIAAVGPVGGWRVRDGVTSEGRDCTPEEIAMIRARLEATWPDPPRRRRKKDGG